MVKHWAMPIFHNSPRETETQETLPGRFYEVGTALIQKLDDVSWNTDELFI